jgi:hypothetical protein
MARLESDADFAIGFEAANAGAVSGAWINDDKRAQPGIDLDPGRRDDAHKRIVDGPFQGSPVNHKLRFIVEHIRHRFRHVFAVLVSPLTHDIPKQDAALERVGRVLHGGSEHAERCRVELR